MSSQLQEMHPDERYLTALKLAEVYAVVGMNTEALELLNSMPAFNQTQEEQKLLTRKHSEVKAYASSGLHAPEVGPFVVWPSEIEGSPGRINLNVFGSNGRETMDVFTSVLMPTAKAWLRIGEEDAMAFASKGSTLSQYERLTLVLEGLQSKRFIDQAQLKRSTLFKNEDNPAKAFAMHLRANPCVDLPAETNQACIKKAQALIQALSTITPQDMWTLYTQSSLPKKHRALLFDKMMAQVGDLSALEDQTLVRLKFIADFVGRPHVYDQLWTILNMRRKEGKLGKFVPNAGIQDPNEHQHYMLRYRSMAQLERDAMSVQVMGIENVYKSALHHEKEGRLPQVDFLASILLKRLRAEKEEPGIQRQLMVVHTLLWKKDSKALSVAMDDLNKKITQMELSSDKHSTIDVRFSKWAPLHELTTFLSLYTTANKQGMKKEADIVLKRLMMWNDLVQFTLVRYPLITAYASWHSIPETIAFIERLESFRPYRNGMYKHVLDMSTHTPDDQKLLNTKIAHSTESPAPEATVTFEYLEMNHYTLLIKSCRSSSSSTCLRDGVAQVFSTIKAEDKPVGSMGILIPLGRFWDAPRIQFMLNTTHDLSTQQVAFKALGKLPQSMQMSLSTQLMNSFIATPNHPAMTPQYVAFLEKHVSKQSQSTLKQAKVLHQAATGTCEGIADNLRQLNLATKEVVLFADIAQVCLLKGKPAEALRVAQVLPTSSPERMNVLMSVGALIDRTFKGDADVQQVLGAMLPPMERPSAPAP